MITYASVSSGLTWNTNGTEKMRLNAAGVLSVGTTDAPGGAALIARSAALYQLALGNYAYSNPQNYWLMGSDASGLLRLSRESTPASGVFMPATATAWVAMSDERKKDIIEPIENATEKVEKLRAVIGKYKGDAPDKRRSFLIAQDVEKVLPEAVTTVDDGYLGVAYTEVIPLLVAAIKELTARVAELEAR
jgi:hypothetical protein